MNKPLRITAEQIYQSLVWLVRQDDQSNSLLWTMLTCQQNTRTQRGIAFRIILTWDQSQRVPLSWRWLGTTSVTLVRPVARDGRSSQHRATRYLSQAKGPRTARLINPLNYRNIPHGNTGLYYLDPASSPLSCRFLSPSEKSSFWRLNWLILESQFPPKRTLSYWNVYVGTCAAKTSLSLHALEVPTYFKAPSELYCAKKLLSIMHAWGMC